MMHNLPETAAAEYSFLPVEAKVPATMAETLPAAGVPVAAAAVGDVAVAAAEIDLKPDAMKKTLIHALPVALSFSWLLLTGHTFNPIILKGPDFLKFYLLLISSFYALVFFLSLFRERISKTTLYFMALLIISGIVKLIKGMILQKPVGFLLIILIGELAVMLSVYLCHFNKRIQ